VTVAQLSEEKQEGALVELKGIDQLAASR
jgi:hypothetical protein